MATKRRTRTTRNRRRPESPYEKELRWDSLFASLGRIEIVLFTGGVMLLLVLIYTIHTILSPFLALGAILFLMYPLRRYVLARNVMWLAITLFAFWFLDSVSTILAPFVISLVFAYMLDPVVDLFEGWKVPRWVSSLVLILLFISGVTLALFFVLPVAISQLDGALDSLSKLTNDARSTLWNSKLLKVLERYGLSADELRATFANQLTPKFEDLLKSFIRAIGSLMSGISSFITQIFYIILIPFLTFYFLTDFPKIAHRFRMFFPRTLRSQVQEYMAQADELIGHYLRGALIVALLQGIVVAVAFSVVGIKYALLLGLLAAIFDLVPYFGLILIMVLAAAMAALSDPPILPKVAFAIGSIGFLHVVEVVFLSPKIVGSKLGLHPLLIILSLLVFMYFLGFVGLLIAVPTTALIILFVRDWERRRHGPGIHDGEATSLGT
jgi:predicted PurR-regulated permease PerM